jgi:hypothetical protein
MLAFCNRKQIFSLAIALYFSIYAASPLFYVCAEQRSSEGLHAVGTESAYGTDLHIFLYELIYSTFDSEYSKEKPEPIAGILLRKKRAVLSDDKASNLIRIADIAKLNEHLFFLSDTSFPISMLSVFNSYENFPLLFSGLSPPQSI